MIKAIFFDIDGTLLSFKTHEVPQSTKDALVELKQKGIKLFIASGRTPNDLDFLMKEYRDIFDGYIGLNGQYCFDKDNNVIREECLDISDLISWKNFLETNNIVCGFLELDYYYFNRAGEVLDKLKKDLGGTAPDRPIDSTERINDYKTYQLNVFLSEDEEDIILKYMPNAKLVRWCPYFTDVIPINGGKPVGMQCMLKHFGLSPKECMAFGDGGNDLEMLQFAKIGIAMGNARDEVKKAADYVTTDVDDNGIANALKHFKLID